VATGARLTTHEKSAPENVVRATFPRRGKSERISAMKKVIVLIMVAMLWSGVAAWSQETFPKVEYISGRATLPKKIKGAFVLTATELRFNNEKGDSVMVVPLSTIKNVTNSIESNPGSTGAKIMLGVFASKKEEFLYVNTETADLAEALVFKCKNKTSPNMMAKIQFQMKKTGQAAMKPMPAGEAAPADSATQGSAKAP
jgi:hypothetical protein